MTFRYRVVLHHGDEQQGRIPEAFVEYAKVDPSEYALTLAIDGSVADTSRVPQPSPKKSAK